MVKIPSCIASIDPAPSKTGMSVLGLESKRFKTYLHVNYPAPSNHFHVWVDRCCWMAERVIRTLSEHEITNMWVVMEFPPASGTFAPALNALDTLIVANLPPSINLYLCSPMRIHSLLGKRAKGKGELKKFLFEILDKNKEFIFPSKINETKADISDATLLLLWVYHNMIENIEVPQRDRPLWKKRWDHEFKKVLFTSVLNRREIKAYV